MSIGALIDRLGKKSWTETDIKKFVGTYLNAYISHATDPAVREYAASGGTTSALLVHGLQHNFFDAAVVCKTAIEDGKVRARFQLAGSPQEILAARGSKYVETRFVKEVLPLLEQHNGRVAVVGLPCDISLLKKRMSHNRKLQDTVVLTIALLCGHNSRKELIDHITDTLQKQENASLTDYRFRVGHWRGTIQASFANGVVRTYPTALFNDYQNLFYCSQKKCLSCFDHYGYNADLSVGDVWLYKLRKESIKKTGLITRTPAGARLFDSAQTAGDVVSSACTIRDIMDGQRRTGPAHYNVSARSKVAPHFGYRIPDSVSEPVKWHQKLNAYFTLKNVKQSETARGRAKVFAKPRKLLKVYLYIKKGLETLG